MIEDLRLEIGGRYAIGFRTRNYRDEDVAILGLGRGATGLRTLCHRLFTLGDETR